MLIHCDLQPSPVLHVSGAFCGTFSIAGALFSVGKENECSVLLLDGYVTVSPTTFEFCDVFVDTLIPSGYGSA